MDCIFNKFIPKSEENKIVLRPTSKTFINGLAPTYDTTYPATLKNHISAREYAYIINKIVDELSMMWPCCFCYTYGYLMSVCTLGLSFCFPFCCISEAKIRLLESLKEANDNVLNKKHLHISYQQKCSTSWLQIDILEGVLKPLDEDEGKFKNFGTNQDLLIKNQLS